MGKTPRVKPILIRRRNSSLSLKRSETLRDYKKRREAWASDPYRPIYHMSSLYGMGDANGLCEWQGRYHLFYQFGSPGGLSGFIGDTAIAKTWCIGKICHLPCILIPNYTASAVSVSWKMSGLLRSITVKCRGIALRLRAIRSCSIGKSIRITLSYRMSRPMNTSSPITSSIHVSGKKKMGIIQSLVHQPTAGSVSGVDLPHTSFIQKT